MFSRKLFVSLFTAGLLSTTPVASMEDGTDAAVSVLFQLIARNGSEPRLRRKPDFNGDGYADLVVGEPGASVNSGSANGQVRVIYGSANGLSDSGNQTIHRGGLYNHKGILQGDIQFDPRDNDRFGSAIATGDFDRDGFSDLAIGVSESIASGKVIAGAVQVLYGSKWGLTAKRNQAWTQSGAWTDPEGDGSGLYIGDLYGGSEDFNRFGGAVTVGDFNNDNYDDLAIGVPQEDIGTLDTAGAVNVIYGSPDGLTWVGNTFFSQREFFTEQNGSGNYADLGDLLGGAEVGDYFGAALAAGDINNDGFDDLAVGVWGEALGTLSDAGAVNIVYGSAAGLTPVNNEFLSSGEYTRDTLGNGTAGIAIGNPEGTEEAGDRFGEVLTMGDFNGDSYADLAVGIPLEDLFVIVNNVGSEVTDVGVVQVFYGSANSLNLPSAEWWRQDGYRFGGDMYGSALESGDRFGESLGSGDINGDGIDDLVIGTPREGFDSTGANTGAVNVLYGTTAGLYTPGIPGHQFLSPVDNIGDQGQSLGSLAGTVNSGDTFGTALTIADFDSDGFAELAIGTPGYQEAGSSDEIGAFHLLEGSADGLQLQGAQVWTVNGGQNASGDNLGDLWGTAADGNDFGQALSRDRGR
jgi:hypothetical protein